MGFIFLYVSTFDEMQPYIAAMIKVRQAFYQALVRSLLRTKSLLKTILDIWIYPVIIKKPENGNGIAENSLNGDVVQPGNGIVKGMIEVNKWLDHVESELRGRVETNSLLALSDGLRAQMTESLVDHPGCMLPSYSHQLPTGDEQGKYLALDVGGSTFRVALIELSGSRVLGQESRILSLKSFKINNAIKQLKGVLFFDWMAQRITETIAGQTEGHDMSKPPLSTGVAWSFPVEQTSLRSGLLQGMGKGFLAAEGLLGQDLGDLIQASCTKENLNIRLNAIVNDSSATLLSKAYLDPTTRFGLILGTGVNCAVNLPVECFHKGKFGERPETWYEMAEKVIVNTEMSMFGKGLLPFARWDEDLKRMHPMPDFQPLEYFVGGGYLGEVVRLVLVEGIRIAGLFGGVIPPSLRERYSLETETISRMEADNTPMLLEATKLFYTRHPTTIPSSHSDIRAVRTIASHVSYRASAVVAAGIHALWQLRNDAESTNASDSEHSVVAYNGSVMENYPQFQAQCQARLDELVEGSCGAKGSVLELEYAEESSLLGAAVAVACLDN